MRAKGQVTIPAGVRQQACFKAGDVLEFSVQPGGRVVVETQNGNGAEIDEASLPPAWAERIDRSIAELEAGLGRVYESEDEFFAALDE